MRASGNRVHSFPIDLDPTRNRSGDPQTQYERDVAQLVERQTRTSWGLVFGPRGDEGDKAREKKEKKEEYRRG